MNIDKYEYLIWKVLTKVPSYIKDDCYQAAYIGLIKALNKRGEDAPVSYFYRAIKSEVIREIAKLDGPGNGLFSIEVNQFLNYCKYRKVSNCKEDLDSLNLSNEKKYIFEKLLNSKRTDVYNRESRQLEGIYE